MTATNQDEATMENLDLVRVAEYLADEGGAVFGGVKLDEKRNIVTSYWHGVVPSAIRQYAETHPHGVRVVLRAVR